MRYRYIRYRWERGNDMEELASVLSEDYIVARRMFPGSNIEVSLFKDDRLELIVTADRMRVHMNAHRAILSQFEDGAFTKHDLTLREKILELYPRSRPTPFPWGHSFEPNYEVEE
ncbi:MAG: hypothetical protein NWF07_10290 [Candidatus Bathyarchaeota archaeon]|nr:hypothetical protein [Candidatus Bathyarchaeota archaeon]